MFEKIYLIRGKVNEALESFYVTGTCIEEAISKANEFFYPKKGIIFDIETKNNKLFTPEENEVLEK